MTIFWILAAGLLGLASLFVALPLLKRPSAGDAPGQDQLNITVFHQRLAELDRDLTAGYLDQDQYEAARRDLERELLYDLEGAGPDTAAPSGGPARPAASRHPWLALALVVLVSTGTVLAYLQIGESAIITRIETLAGLPPPHAGGAPGAGAAPLDVLVQGLAERMEKNPENLEGWLMLGRTYFAIGQPAKGLQAIERAYKRAPDESSVLIAYAEALAANNGNRFDGRPAELIRTVLTREPGNPSALWLDGMIAFQQQRFSDAAEIWQGLVEQMDPAGEEAQQIGRMIAEAQGRAGPPRSDAMGEASGDAGPGPLAQAQPGSGSPATDSAPPETPSAIAPPGTDSAPQESVQGSAGDASAGAAIKVTVSLAPDIAVQAGPEDALFVYARAASGPPMPLAVQRLRVSDLPATVTLDDSMAVMPTMRLSAFPQVVVGARISRSGQATPQAGDLEGQTAPIGAREGHTVSVVIDRVRP